MGKVGETVRLSERDINCVWRIHENGRRVL